MSLNNKIKISIVILTYNGESFLDGCLSGIFKQNIDSNFEVICIDSGSKDSTVEICQKYPVRIVRIDKKDFNHGLTRNLGASLSKGEFIVFISQDAIPYDSNWLKDLVKVIEKDERIAGVYCRKLPRQDACYFTKWQMDGYFPKQTQVRWLGHPDEYDALSPEERYRACQFDDVCSCVRKSIWKKFNFRNIGFGEDIEWSKRVLESGYKIAYCKEAAVIHFHKLTLIETYRRSYLHHKTLFNLFGFKVFPSFFSFLKNLVGFPLLAILYYIRKEKDAPLALIELPRVALLSILSVFGQYFGSLF